MYPVGSLSVRPVSGTALSSCPGKHSVLECFAFQRNLSLLSCPNGICGDHEGIWHAKKPACQPSRRDNAGSSFPYCCVATAPCCSFFLHPSSSGTGVLVPICCFHVPVLRRTALIISSGSMSITNPSVKLMPGILGQ